MDECLKTFVADEDSDWDWLHALEAKPGPVVDGPDEHDYWFAFYERDLASTGEISLIERWSGRTQVVAMKRLMTCARAGPWSSWRKWAAPSMVVCG